MAGFVGPVGLGAPVLVDTSVVAGRGYVSGANKKDAHLRDVVNRRDFNGEEVDAHDVREGDLCPKCGKGHLEIKRGVDAIRSNRPYRAGASHQVAMQRLHEGAGTHFDPKMVEAFAEMVHDLNERYGPVLHTVEAPQEVPQHPHPIPAEGARKAG